mmetsp:Transcript_28733/g.40319  ORF Transcript_28733/g.40319 Transcript_28733/m.40319 type:complete len:81 (+) Transcript_28733:569-811(+)
MDVLFDENNTSPAPFDWNNGSVLNGMRVMSRQMLQSCFFSMELYGVSDEGFHSKAFFSVTDKRKCQPYEIVSYTYKTNYW